MTPFLNRLSPTSGCLTIDQSFVVCTLITRVSVISSSNFLMLEFELQSFEVSMLESSTQGVNTELK